MSGDVHVRFCEHLGGGSPGWLDATYTSAVAERVSGCWWGYASSTIDSI